MPTNAISLGTSLACGVPSNTIFTRVGDIGSTVIGATVRAERAVKSAQFNGLTGNQKLVQDSAVEVDGSTLTYTLNDVAIGAATTMVCYFRLIYEDDTIDSTDTFSILVRPDAESQSTGVPEAYYSEINDLMEQMQRLIDEGAEYDLPPATTDKLGGVIVGDSLTATAGGTLSVSAGTFDGYGAADAALTAAKQAITDSAESTLDAAQEYADGLAPNYDASGSADAALTAAKTYSDSGDAATLTAAKEYTNDLTTGALSREVVDELPSDPATNVIYMVPKADAGASNVYSEYMYINEAWELLGDTEVDLSGYATTDALDEAVEDAKSYADSLVASIVDGNEVAY